MIGTMMFSLVLFLFASSVSCDVPPEFTADNFDVRIKEKPFTLVMFYAPWCGHCKRMKPSFITAAKRLEATTDNTALALVDCTAHEQICTKFSVSGYPTVKLFKNGEFSQEFDGSRDEDGIVEYMLQRSKPTTSELASAAQLTSLLEGPEAAEKPVVISFVTSNTDSWFEKHTQLSSELLGDVVFAHTFDPKVLDVSAGKNVVRLFRPRSLKSKLEEHSVDYDGDWDPASIKKWIKTNGHGLVGYRTVKNSFFFPTDNLVVFYFNASLDSYPKGVNYYRNRLIKLIRTAKKADSTFIYAYSSHMDFLSELRDLDLPLYYQGPYVAIFAGWKRYKLEKYEPDAFVKFLEAFEAGTLTHHVRSEKIPTEQTGPLTKVVGRTFDKLVNDPTKDVFVMFHALWCGHCKELMPKFEAAAAKLKGETDILMATYDATANEVPPPFEVKSYPTLYFVPKAAKQTPIKYQGLRETDDLVKFVAQESSQELKGYDKQGNEKKQDL